MPLKATWCSPEASWLHWKVLLWRMYRRLFGGDKEPLDVPGWGFGALGGQVGGIFEMLMEIHGQQILLDACLGSPRVSQ